MREIYIGYAGVRSLSTIHLLAKGKPRELKHWSLDHSLRITLIGPPPRVRVDDFLASFLKGFKDAGYRIIGRPGRLARVSA